MSQRPIAVALERGPASCAALRVAADMAAHLGCPLEGYALGEGAIPTLRALRRLKRAGRRRDVATSFVRPAGGGLLAASTAASRARLLVCARSPGRRAPGVGRRHLLAGLLRQPGPPVLIVPPRCRPLGDRVLIAWAGGAPEAVLPLYAVVKPFVTRVSILRWLPRGGELALDAGLDECMENALAWDERIVHGDEGHELGMTVIAAAERTSPTLVALGRPATGPRLAALIAPEAADRAVSELSVPVIVARRPAGVAAAA